jgi:nicotinamidase-related amidase
VGKKKQTGGMRMLKQQGLSAIGALVATAISLGGLPIAQSQAQTIIDNWTTATVPPAPQLKPVTVDPKTTALLLLDFISRDPYCGPAKPHCVASLPAMKKLLTEARAHGTTVIYSLAPNFSASDIHKDIAPAASDPLVQSAADKFLNTNLEKLLKDRGIQTVIVAGTAANGAVLYTGSEAGLRGFKVIVPVDGLSANDSYAEQFTAWQLANGPRFSALVTLTKSDMIKF